MDLQRVALIAARECERQQVDLFALARLLDAYNFVYLHWPPDEQIGMGHILQLGANIDPEKANHLRRTPVTFQNGGTSANHQDIYDLLKSRITDLNNQHIEIDEFIREFLWIHPFEDGNGRTAWVLMNWLYKSMDFPIPLKEYRW